MLWVHLCRRGLELSLLQPLICSNRYTQNEEVAFIIFLKGAGWTTFLVPFLPH